MEDDFFVGHLDDCEFVFDVIVWSVIGLEVRCVSLVVVVVVGKRKVKIFGRRKTFMCGKTNRLALT